MSGVIVTGNFFDLLGVTAAQGRLLAPSDDVTPGAHPVAVISHRLWQTRFGGRTDIVGQRGPAERPACSRSSASRRRSFPGRSSASMRDVYVPMMMQALMRPPRAGYSGEMNPDLLKNPNNGWLFQVGRLKPGVTAEQAQAELVALATTYVAHAANPNARPTAARRSCRSTPAIQNQRAADALGRHCCSAASSAPCCSSPARTSRTCCCRRRPRGGARSRSVSRSARAAGASSGSC